MRESRLTSGLRARLERNVFLVVVFAVCVTIHGQVIPHAVVQDAWYSLLGGRTVIHSGLPHHDTWTLYSLGKQWVDEQWLGHVLLYGLWAAGGWRLALVGVLALFLAAFLVLTATARRLGASDLAVAAVTILAYLTGISNSAMRAQIPAYLLFAVVFALLMTDSRRPSHRVYLVLPLLVLWANIHGSAVLGAALVSLRGLTIVGEGLFARAHPRSWGKRAGALVCLPWLAVLVTPYGLGVIHYYRTTIGNSALKNSTTEWGPTTLTGQPLYLVLLLVAVWLVARSRRATTPFEQVALLATGLLGLDAIRYGIWFTLVAVGTLPLALDSLWKPTTSNRRVGLNLALGIAGLSVAALSVLATAVHDNAWFERSYPRKAELAVAAAARADPSIRVFADERYADWLMFEDPSLEGRTAFDVRFELLTAKELTSLIDYRVELGVHWEKAARGYGLLVLDPVDDKKTIKLLARRPGARILFRDKHVAVIERPT